VRSCRSASRATDCRWKPAVVAFDAVDRDGHHLLILVDGDGDLGLSAPVANSVRPARATGRKHFTFGLQAVTYNVAAAPLSPSPGVNMRRVRLKSSGPSGASFMRSPAQNKAAIGGFAEQRIFRLPRRLVANSSWLRNLLATSAFLYARPIGALPPTMRNSGSDEHEIRTSALPAGFPVKRQLAGRHSLSHLLAIPISDTRRASCAVRRKVRTRQPRCRSRGRCGWRRSRRRRRCAVGAVDGVLGIPTGTTIVARGFYEPLRSLPLLSVIFVRHSGARVSANPESRAAISRFRFIATRCPERHAFAHQFFSR